MTTPFQDVIDFHKKFGLPIGATPEWPREKIMNLRKELLDEELVEFFSAEMEGDLANWAAEIVDVIYILIGTAVSAGIDLGPIWAAIHDSNMQKMARPGGHKPIKPIGWQAPNIEALLQKQSSSTSD